MIIELNKAKLKQSGALTEYANDPIEIKFWGLDQVKSQQFKIRDSYLTVVEFDVNTFKNDIFKFTIRSEDNSLVIYLRFPTKGCNEIHFESFDVQKLAWEATNIRDFLYPSSKGSETLCSECDWDFKVLKHLMLCFGGSLILYIDDKIMPDPKSGMRESQGLLEIQGFKNLMAAKQIYVFCKSLDNKFFSEFQKPVNLKIS